MQICDIQKLTQLAHEVSLTPLPFAFLLQPQLYSRCMPIWPLYALKLQLIVMWQTMLTCICVG